MQMPNVKKCDVSECAYNKNDQCHALAITVGDETHPQCDTFCFSQSKGGDPAGMAGVGACKVSSCAFNQSLECQAKGIDVGYNEDKIDCLTFKAG